MKLAQAGDLGTRIASLVEEGEVAPAYALLAPVLATRTPFPALGRIGAVVGGGPLEPTNAFLDHVASHRTEGGWVVIGCALGEQLERDPAGALSRCRRFVVAGHVWYAADILAERVPGPALVARFSRAIELLRPWPADDDAWVRRATGVAVHFWAHRSRGAAELASRARTLLKFLEPSFGEWEMNAAKGIAWALKTLGRHYPDLLADWLARDVVPGSRRHRALMLRKALTHLSDEQRARATESVAR
jgi:3-methyladenine DNA glycosylase AlkD